MSSMNRLQSFGCRMQQWMFRCILPAVLFFAANGSAQRTSEAKQFEYGEKLYSQGLFSLAEIQFEDFIQSYPSSPKVPDAQYFMGESQFMQEKYDEGVRTYSRLLISTPASNRAPESQFRIAQCFERTGRIAEAIVSYARVYDFYPHHALAEAGLLKSGQLALAQKNFAAAEKAFTTLMEDGPEGIIRWEASSGLADILLERNDYQQALLILRPFTQEGDPGSIRFRAGFRLSKLYETLGRWDEAEA